MPTYSGDESISGEHLKEFLRLLAARLQVVNDDEKILLDETASHKKDLSPDRLERLKSLMQILSMENAYLEHCKERIEAFANPSSPRASLSLQEVDNAFFMYKGASLKDSVNNQSQDKHTTLQRIAGLEGGGRN